VTRVAAEGGLPRVAYAVGRAAGGAVARNRVRRRLRAATRAHAALLAPGHAYLVGAGAGADELGYAELAADLADLLARANGADQ
jgi:ribonuclease P protein component